MNIIVREFTKIVLDFLFAFVIVFVCCLLHKKYLHIQFFVVRIFFPFFSTIINEKSNDLIQSK